MSSRKRQKAKPSEVGVEQVPMAYPDRSGPKSKTLFELAEEREAELLARADAINNARRQESRKTQEAPPDAADDARGERMLNALLYAISLTMVHFTFDVLVFNQYGQEILWSYILGRLVPTFPILLLVIYLFHTDTANKFPVAKQVMLGGIATMIGCHLVWISNKSPYLAVMMQTPPLVVALIWMVIESRLETAAFILTAVGIWVKYHNLPLW